MCGIVSILDIQGDSKQLREKGIIVALGGVHVTLLPEEAQIHADAIVVGYAEQSWPQLLHDYKNNELKSIYNYPFADVYKDHNFGTHHYLMKKNR